LAFDVVLEDIEYLKANFEDIQVLEEVGKGGYATVFRGSFNGETVAVKRIDMVEENNGTDELVEKFGEFRREALLMR
jgi:hypothetical protein